MKIQSQFLIQTQHKVFLSMILKSFGFWHMYLGSHVNDVKAEQQDEENHFKVNILSKKLKILSNTQKLCNEMLEKQHEECTRATCIKRWHIWEKETNLVKFIQLPALTTVEETWQKATHAVSRAAQATLGVTKPGRHQIDWETWLWTDDIEAKKKWLYCIFFNIKLPVNW